ncbi:Ca-activated chloride channel family protein [Friedmanniella endophytica]|uniref:Ca-activated chloride channel family protein n=1 Tax=Microlunatus kandeliicorticis TaxID=1759536 RepID=A0A7W3IT72_9ACTN|nr:Ca-activated chloride channel family protein [Microlunatus kandeliicorticis]
MLALAVLLAAAGALLGPLSRPARAEETSKLMLVLDSSGSMAQKSQGEVKIDAARKALTQTVGSLPASVNVGFRVFGATVFNAGDKGACTDSQLKVPVGTDNQGQLDAAIKAVKPYGETPIGYALQQAAKDLGSSGKRTIVLVTDGESTCKPDPCDVASTLTRSGTGLAIDVIGLNVDGSAQSQLKCIASRGKGSYYDAADAETLANSLQTLVQRSRRNFQVGGTPVVGSAAPAQAPVITAGEYNDELPPTGAGDLRWYHLYRNIVGSTLHVSASINRLGRPDAVALEVRTPSGQLCATSSAFRADAFGSNLLSAAVSVGPRAGKAPVAACTSSNDLLVAVRHADRVDGTPVYGGKQTDQVSLQVIEERPVSGVAGLPKPATAGKFVPQFGGSTKPVVGGSSFDDAPTLGQGAYSSNLVPGETQVFLVKQTWGQSVDATLTFPGASGKLASQLGNGQVRANITMFSPNRGPATTNAGGQENVLTKERLVLGLSSTPVRYLNRSQDVTRASSYLPGSYAVVVSLSADPQNQNYVVPYLLNLDVRGRSSGAPDYVANPTPAPAPPSPTPVPAPGSRSGGVTTGTVIGIVVAVAVLLGAGVTAVIVRRRRRRGDAAAG